METIITGRFDTWDQAERTTLALLNLTGIRKEDICTFYIGPPGQHASYPSGGDQDADPEANKAHNKSMVGGAIGAGPTGLAALPAGSDNRGYSMGHLTSKRQKACGAMANGWILIRLFLPAYCIKTNQAMCKNQSTKTIMSPIQTWAGN